MINYIGLDAHSATCTFVNLNEKGKEIAQCTVKTTEANILGFIKSQKGVKKLTFEESGLSKWLHILIKDKVDELIVCHPGYLSKRKGARDDYPDALQLANELRCNNLTPVFHEVSDFMEMRSLIGAYQDVVNEGVRTKNRYKALFRAEALDTKGKTIYNQPERIKELSMGMDKFVAEQLMEQLVHLDGIKSKYKTKLRDNCKRHKALRNLCTVPGIDIVRANIIAALICAPARFKTKHNFWAYCMLVKYIDISDGNTYGRRLVQGRRELKNVFLGIAECVLKGESGLRKYYDRLRSKGIDHRAAKYDVARKSAAICLSILKHNKAYDDKYKEKQRRKEKQRKKNKNRSV